MRISDWSSDVCSSDLEALPFKGVRAVRLRGTAARTERTTGALRRAGRVGMGWVSPPPPQSRPNPIPIPAFPLKGTANSRTLPARRHARYDAHHAPLPPPRCHRRLQRDRESDGQGKVVAVTLDRGWTR